MEANLARVEDVLAELRPQARRLGQLAEQQATRLTAGEELATALLAAAHVRWHEAAAKATAARGRRDGARAEVDRTLVALEEAERQVAAIAAELDARSSLERERRTAHEQARTEVTGLRLREARIVSEQEAVARDAARLADERAGSEADLELQRRALAAPAPERDVDLEASLAEAERSLADALGELGALRAAERAHGEELAALRRAEAARVAEGETARRRLADVARRADEARAQATAVDARRLELEALLAEASAAVTATTRAEQLASAARDEAASALEAADGRRQAAVERAGAAGAALATGRGRLDGLTARLEEDEARGIARAARKLGGRRVDDELVVDPALRAAVEAALGDLVRAYVLPRAEVGAVADERGAIVVAESRAETHPGDAAALDAVRAAGGGALADAVRRDPGDVVKSLLAAVGWVPTLDDALAVQPELPAGWRVVVRDGSAVVDARTVRLGRGDGLLERRAEADRLTRDLERLATETNAATEAAELAGRAAAHARSSLDQARDAERAAEAERQAAETRERSVGRDLEAAVREAAWQAAQVERLATDAERARSAVADQDGRDGAADEAAGAGVDRSAIATWEARAAELRSRRDRLATDHTQQEAARREAEGRRARAEAAVAMDERRIASATAELAAIAEREAARQGERADLALALAAATDRERHAAAELESLLAADAGDRARLGEAERSASGARERLRAAEDRLRSIEVADLEARLGLESLREQTLVELAGLGELGVRHLVAAAGGTLVEPGPEAETTDDEDTVDDDPARLERALAAVTPMWAGAPSTVEPPTPGRLATLRRRYHELGAANPFAVEEYAALRERLDDPRGPGRRPEGRDRQDARRSSPSSTRSSRRASGRPSPSSRSAFDTRFQQLFGGGFARLSLTDPGDLTATGIEIVARPPGKKPQALAMLSGGERALTAVALLFAMLEVRPVPVLRPRRGRCGARRGEHRPVHARRCASSRSGRSSSSSRTTAARSRRPTRSTA